MFVKSNDLCITWIGNTEEVPQSEKENIYITVKSDIHDLRGDLC